MVQMTTAFTGEEISVHHTLPTNIRIQHLDEEVVVKEELTEYNSFLMTPMVLYDADQEYIVYIYVNNCILSDLEVTVNNQLLQIKCRKNRNTNSAGWFRWCSNMSLGILLPHDANAAYIKACHSNGLLKITIDKI
ncbi:HSP20 family molecular chaperone IbpA [Methylohalomonas lacus]|uniref:HSP20 family molecular chaperone IbpA n=1 Tax=Methylohalomonas lacus TaxID=398773 RepID=A0AAE3HKV2_9GAMM|nr:Hsp20/alpha crystallin family protein [Methylohalomonas lacus]MCS3902812.1 HSP20 family molecular chaperone IbpA [Methylohalomonas lacus]